MRGPDEIRQQGNGLVGSGSAYLREHAHDPIDWQPWTDATLARAVKEERPIFLSIGYIACHFCHVMHDEVFSKNDVARVLNERFIAIKVDREERPDIDATYIAALERMTGSAGWPANLFLTPRLDPFHGGTYVPHDAFLETARLAADRYAKERDGGSLVAVPIRAVDAPQAPGATLAADELRAFAAAAPARMDLRRGGFKSSAKFPLPTRLSFLLHATRKWDLPDLALALRTTLDAIANGALRDPISGGFHRYTTDAAWTTPHYEIMLYDVAQLASLYQEAAIALAEPRYSVVAAEALDFLDREMRVPSGGFASSFDADTRGAEGAAWRWTLAEITTVIGAADARLVGPFLGIGEAKVAPSRRVTVSAVALNAGVLPVEVDAAWVRARPLLRQARKGIALRDDKVVTAWNGLAIEAFARAFAATGNSHYRDVAVEVAESIWRDQHEATHRLTRTPGGADAFAVDQGDLAIGYLALFEATSEPMWLSRADLLLHEAKAFESPEGGFHDGAGELARTIATDDGVEPSATGALLRALVARDGIEPGAATRAPIDRAMRRYGNELRRNDLGASVWLDAALLDLGPAYEVVVAGDASALEVVAARALAPWAHLVRVPAAGAGPELLGRLPSLEAKTAKGGIARAFVCKATACKAPTSDPLALRAAMLEGWLR